MKNFLKNIGVLAYVLFSALWVLCCIILSIGIPLAFVYAAWHFICKYW